MATMAVRVRWALETLGSRKMGTPLLTASTPVMAVQPLAKARTNIQLPTATAEPETIGGATTGTGWPPLVRAFQSPIAITAPRVSTKA
jgi:hypothetical protein